MSACPSDVTQPTDPDQGHAVVTWTDPIAIDNSHPYPVVHCAPESGSRFPVEIITEVICEATDYSDNYASCIFTVSVTKLEGMFYTCLVVSLSMM